MSVKFLDRVWDDQSITDRIELLVLLSLADQANNEGICYPGVESIAKRTRISVRSAQYAIKRLVESGRLEITEGASRYSTNLYRIVYKDDEDARGANCACSGVQGLHQGGARMRPVLAPKPSLTVRKPFEDSTAQKNDSPSEADVEAIYDAYPRKVGKQAALKAIRSALKSSAIPAATMLGLVQLYARSYSGDRQYIPYPASWFNAGRYNDDPEEWKRHNGSQTNQGVSMPLWRRINVLEAAYDAAKEASELDPRPEMKQKRAEAWQALQKAKSEELQAARQVSA